MTQLPRTLVAVRQTGELDDPYWLAGSHDGHDVHLEPAEEIAWVGTAQLRLPAGRDAVLPMTRVGVTNHRITLLSDQFDTGGGWVGLGGGATVVATAINMASKAQARKRSVGRVAVGHVRHEWITSLGLTTVKGLTVTEPTCSVEIGVTLHDGPATVTLEQSAMLTDELFDWLVGVVRWHRSTLLAVSIDQVGSETRHGSDRLSRSWRAERRWDLAGDPASLIPGVYAGIWPTT